MKRKIVYLVLNERPGAKVGWPLRGCLAAMGTNRHCCIGVDGMRRGLPKAALCGLAFPSPDDDPDYFDAWELPIDELREENPDFLAGETVGDTAAFLNDSAASNIITTAEAVARLRIVWRWMGLQQSPPEDWRIRHLT